MNEIKSKYYIKIKIPKGRITYHENRGIYYINHINTNKVSLIIVNMSKLNKIAKCKQSGNENIVTIQSRELIITTSLR